MVVYAHFTDYRHFEWVSDLKAFPSFVERRTAIEHDIRYHAISRGEAVRCYGDKEVSKATAKLKHTLRKKED